MVLIIIGVLFIVFVVCLIRDIKNSKIDPPESDYDEYINNVLKNKKKK